MGNGLKLLLLRCLSYLFADPLLKIGKGFSCRGTLNGLNSDLLNLLVCFLQMLGKPRDLITLFFYGFLERFNSRCRVRSFRQ